METEFKFYLLDPFNIPNKDFMEYMKAALPQYHQWDEDIFNEKNADDMEFRQTVLTIIDENYSCMEKDDDVSIANN